MDHHFEFRMQQSIVKSIPGWLGWRGTHNWILGLRFYMQICRKYNTNKQREFEVVTRKGPCCILLRFRWCLRAEIEIKRTVLVIFLFFSQSFLLVPWGKFFTGDDAIISGKLKFVVTSSTIILCGPNASPNKWNKFIGYSPCSHRMTNSEQKNSTIFHREKNMQLKYRVVFKSSLALPMARTNPIGLWMQT